MEDQLDEMRGGGQQTERLIILNTGQMSNAAKTASAARDQAKAAQDSVKAIQRQMRQDQRAWITVKIASPEFSESKPFFVPITFTNTGKTPARHFTAAVFVERVQNGKSPSFEYKNSIGTTATVGTVFPGGVMLHRGFAFRLDYTAKTAEGINTLSPAELRELIDAKAYIATYGKITFTDIFGTSHWVKFCAFSSPAESVWLAGAKKCTDYDEVDNN